jgi:hypothetical protein
MYLDFFYFSLPIFIFLVNTTIRLLICYEFGTIVLSIFTFFDTNQNAKINLAVFHSARFAGGCKFAC